jgi:hypothetical protein
MSQYHTINAGEVERGFTVVARLDGSPITTGTVSYYLKCKSGSNAGKWWRNSDQSWQASETANTMSHDADGHFDILLTAGAAGPFVAGVRYREYVKESGDLHVPDGRLLVCDAAPGTTGGPLIVGTGAGAVNANGGKVPATIASGDNSDKTGYSVAGKVAATIAVGDNSDKAGYSLAGKVAATIAPGDNSDKTGYSLAGGSNGIGPTANVADDDIHTTAFKNGTVRLCAHVYKDGADIHRADVSTIVYSVFLLDDQDADARTAVTGHSAVSLAAADVIFDTLQNDSQASGYNFKHIIPIGVHPAFTIAGRNYLAEYTIAPAVGEKLILRFRVHVL